MSAMPARLARLGHYRIASSLLIGCGVTVVSTLVYFAWATSPLQQIKIAEVVGQAKERVFVNSQPAQTGTPVSTGQQVLTLPEARVGLRQGNQVIARLGTQSSAILESDCIQLGEGQIVISSTAGCLGAAIAKSENGIFVLERLATLGEVKVISGEVSLAIPSNPSIGTITLRANQKLTLSLTGDEIGPVRLMLPTEVNELAQGELFQGFQQAIANQQAIVGLLPPVTPIPSPTPSAKPTPTQPVKNTQPPADKVPAAVPPPPAPALSSRAPADLPSSRIDHAPEVDTRNDYTASVSSSTYPYKRSTRRRRTVEPSYESYSYRRKWTRSPSGSSSSRRRTPTYSTPTYSAPTHSTPTQPAPVDDLPTVPEISEPEVITPIELPPTAPPSSDPLPPPAIAEPPLAAPDGK